jgi:hypothetical protein
LYFIGRSSLSFAGAQTQDGSHRNRRTKHN